MSNIDTQTQKTLMQIIKENDGTLVDLHQISPRFKVISATYDGTRIYSITLPRVMIKRPARANFAHFEGSTVAFYALTFSEISAFFAENVTMDATANPSEIGFFDAKRRFHIAPEHHTPSSRKIRTPSAAWPFSEYKHIFTKKYAQQLAAQIGCNSITITR